MAHSRAADGGWLRRTRSRARSRKRLALVVVVLVAGTVVARRMGYKIGGNVVVRCRQGHLFTTIWVPGVSIKSIRLGWVRLQRCPVGQHWTAVKPVKDRDLSDEERRAAAAHRDIRLP